MGLRWGALHSSPVTERAGFDRRQRFGRRRSLGDIRATAALAWPPPPPPNPQSRGGGWGRGGLRGRGWLRDQRGFGEAPVWGLAPGCGRMRSAPVGSGPPTASGVLGGKTLKTKSFPGGFGGVTMHVGTQRPKSLPRGGGSAGTALWHCGAGGVPVPQFPLVGRRPPPPPQPCGGDSARWPTWRTGVAVGAAPRWRGDTALSRWALSRWALPDGRWHPARSASRRLFPWLYSGFPKK